MGFSLNIGALETALDVLVFMATAWHWGDEERGSFLILDAAAVLGDNPDSRCPNAQLGLPFMPFWKRPSGEWIYWCPELRHDGRCGIYDRRPAICRVFKAGADDQLCAMRMSERPHDPDVSSHANGPHDVGMTRFEPEQRL